MKKTMIPKPDFTIFENLTGTDLMVGTTPLARQPIQSGDRDVLRAVFEIDLKRLDDTPCAAFRESYSPWHDKKFNLKKFLRDILACEPKQNKKTSRAKSKQKSR